MCHLYLKFGLYSFNKSDINTKCRENKLIVVSYLRIS
jgi:hypothetical protein